MKRTPVRSSPTPRPTRRQGWRAQADRLRRRAIDGAAATRRTILRRVPQRFHAITDEMAKFGTIGLINLGVNFGVFNLLLLLPIMAGAEVKSKAAATVVAATCAYFLNRYWTYRHRPKTTLRREYSLFFLFNAIGLVIETAFVAMAKYGFNSTHFVVLNVCSFLGIAVGTVFRFWAYRTHVFKPETPAGGTAEKKSADQKKPAGGKQPTASENTAGAKKPAGEKDPAADRQPAKAKRRTTPPERDDELDGELVQLELDKLVHDERGRARR
jgi:putative flippase GtrA